MVNVSKLKNQLSYNPVTGVFKWKGSGSGRRIVFDQQEYTSGQIAWTIMTGQFPDFIIDHKDGNPLNDKWENLRRGDKGIDQRNARRQRRNKTGCTGVKLNKGYYLAYIGVGKGKQKYLGCSKDLFEAVCLRKKAEAIYGYGEAHGTDRKFHQ